MKRALVIGGTGPTGPHILQGLIDRDYATTIFHRGTHEPPDLPDVEHIHGDPHFAETIQAALAGREFDLVIATYGRIRYITEAFAHRCERFMAVGGVPVYSGLLNPEEVHPFGLEVMASEKAPLATVETGSRASRFAHLIYQTERQVLDLSDSGAFEACYFRYPAIYGPRQPNPMDWSIIKRVLDGRKQMILPDGGLIIMSRCAAINAAQHILLAIDNPVASKGQVYNCVDENQYTLRQLTELISEFAGNKLDIVSLPHELAAPAQALTRQMDIGNHWLLDGAKARLELGYQDLIPAIQGIQESVQWYLQNPLTSEDNPNYPDPFDYAAEDKLIAAYQQGIEQIKKTAPFEKVKYYHSYAHPKKPDAGPDHRGR
ncbi:MAG: NAD-dependent epimerase/dehydratase family protein [Pseudomonadales bacterium]|nr:NAD-dependent epimerase/dehydratase family protein [Pseudomonadales bacterium]